MEKNVCNWFKDRYMNCYLSVHAAQVAFFIIVSFFPLLMFIASMARFTPIDKDLLVNAISMVIPGTLGDMVKGWLDEIFSSRSFVFFSITIIAVLWSGSKGFDGLSIALDRIYGIKPQKQRIYFLRRFLSLIYLVVFVVMILANMTIMVYGGMIFDKLKNIISSFGFSGIVMNILRISISFVIFLSFFLILYRFVPGIRTVKKLSGDISKTPVVIKRTLKKEIPGAIIASILWIAFSYLYSFYVNRYNEITSIYGSLTHMVLFMLWLYFCIIFLFIGAMINCYRYETGETILSRIVPDLISFIKSLIPLG